MKKIFLVLSLLSVLVVGCNAVRTERLLGGARWARYWETTDGKQIKERSIFLEACQCTRIVNRSWGAHQDAWWINHVISPPDQLSLHVIHHNEGIQTAFDECMVRLGYRRVIYIEPDRYYEFY